MKPLFSPRNILVTGGAGFIGSCFVRQSLAEHDDARIVNLDLLTYAGNPDNLSDLADHPSYTFVRGDIRDADLVARLLAEHDIDSIVHFAAESHVDNSITGPAVFFETNVLGTQNLLEQARRHGKIGRFLNVGTDEVYGALKLGTTDEFVETMPLLPNSPYSASKAAGDHVTRAYFHTFELPTLITRCSNNYGPRQFPEKLIPLMIRNAMADKSLPVYGDGLYVRDWLHVEDHARGIWAALEYGEPGEVYNIGGRNERPNIEVVKTILRALGKPESLIEYVKDRPGHDRRYAINAQKLGKISGWEPTILFDEGIAMTIEWYRDNPEWLARIESGEYQKEQTA